MSSFTIDIHYAVNQVVLDYPDTPVISGVKFQHVREMQRIASGSSAPDKSDIKITTEVAITSVRKNDHYITSDSVIYKL